MSRFARLNAVLVAVLGIAAGSLRAEPQTENERILAALALREGMRVADVGAGDGRYTTALAEQVGASGHVFATEVDEAELAKIRARVAEAGLSNVTAVAGDQKATGLQPSCCDAILLRLVYHHFTDPSVMRRDLWRALRPGGRIAVIEVPPKPNWRRLQGVPERGGHGIEAQALLAEMQGSGFVVAEHHESWPAEEDGYCVVFERPSPPAAARLRGTGDVARFRYRSASAAGPRGPAGGLGSAVSAPGAATEPCPEAPRRRVPSSRAPVPPPPRWSAWRNP